MNQYDKVEQLIKLRVWNSYLEEDMNKSPAKEAIKLLVENNYKIINELQLEVEKFTVKSFCKKGEHKPNKYNNCDICGRALKQVWIEIE